MDEEYSTKRLTIPALEEILGKEFPVLDHGFVRVIDYMGGDPAVADAARVSYGQGTDKIRGDRGLIRYLMRHKHTSPSEMVELKWHCKMPIFVARQWIRHRTANVNEISGRYSILDKEFYIPGSEVIAAQSTVNKQGRGEVLPVDVAKKVRTLLIEDSERNYSHYEKFLQEDNLARELARMGLSLNFYTQWYWKNDLHNTLHFLELRMDEHAQYEIREYAKVMASIIKRFAPFEWEAFEDYVLNAVTFSAPELAILGGLLKKDVDFEDLMNYTGAGFVVKGDDGKKKLSDEGLEFKGKLKKAFSVVYKKGKSE